MNPLFIIYIYLALVDIEEKRTHAAKSSSGESLIVDDGPMGRVQFTHTASKHTALIV